MKTAKRQLRSGFTGIELLIPVVIFVVLIAVLANQATTITPVVNQSRSPNVNPHTVTETARAGTAVMHMMHEANADTPAIDAPVISPPDVDPVVPEPVPDVDLGDIIGGLLEGL